MKPVRPPKEPVPPESQKSEKTPADAAAKPIFPTLPKRNLADLPAEPKIPSEVVDAAMLKNQYWRKLKQPLTKKHIDGLLSGEIELADVLGYSPKELMELTEAAFSAMELRRFKEATTLFEGLKALKPREPYFRTCLGVIELRQKKFGTAVAFFREVLVLQPGDINTWVLCGETQIAAGDWVGAAESFRQALELDPDGKHPMANRARLLVLAALRAIENAAPIAKPAG